MFRSIWVYAVGAVTTPFFASVAIVASYLDQSSVSCRCTAIARRWSRGLMNATGSTVTVHGLEHFDANEPHILIANHQSWFDVFALCGWLPGSFRFVAKKELARIPLFGPAWQRCGHVSIDRKDLTSAIGALDTAAGRIARDKLMIAMFPEGTRSSDGVLQPFKKGAFVLAISAGVPLVPVAIRGTRDIMPKGRWRIRKGAVNVHVGPAIETTGYEHADRDRLRDEAFDALQALLRKTATETGTPDAESPVHQSQSEEQREADVRNR